MADAWLMFSTGKFLHLADHLLISSSIFILTVNFFSNYDVSKFLLGHYTITPITPMLEVQGSMLIFTERVNIREPKTPIFRTQAFKTHVVGTNKKSRIVAELLRI
jgi:hypothetical protein